MFFNTIILPRHLALWHSHLQYDFDTGAEGGEGGDLLFLMGTEPCIAYCDLVEMRIYAKAKLFILVSSPTKSGNFTDDFKLTLIFKECSRIFFFTLNMNVVLGTSRSI